MSDSQRPWFDAQHPATDSQRPWIEEPVSDDLAALKAKARLKHNNRGRCYPRRRCFECRDVYPCLTIRLLDESDRLEAAQQEGPRWLDGPPTEPGAYWWCFHDNDGKPINGVMRLTVVRKVGRRLVVPGGEGGSLPVSKPRRLWYGPFQEPEVPE